MKIAMIMLAAGNSRRFGTNKLLYEINGMSMYQHVLCQLQQAKDRLENKSKLQKELSSICNSTGKKSGGADEVCINKCSEEVPDIKCGITVVTQYDAIAESVRKQGIQVLYNLHPEMGISSSLKVGLSANMKTDAVLFAVADQPWLTCETICGLILAFLHSKKEIACISCRGETGNPCIFKKKYYEELLALKGDKGGKRVIMKHLEDTCIYEVMNARELEDIDYRDQ